MALMLARLLSIALLLFALTPARAQQNVPFPGAIELEQSLHKLNELGTVLMIAAHPDDERTAVLAYFARGRYMRTAYLSITRGEGGQNLIGSEQGPQMGVIRTQELLAARKIDGAEQFFTRAIDFGFTKTASETLEKWGHDRILSDVVWVIRRYRPDVIILGFSGTPADGHGQHQVSAILGREAFDAAADPTKFPEQLKYVKPWQATRIVHAGFGGAGRGGPGLGLAPGTTVPAPPPATPPPATATTPPATDAAAAGNGRGGRGGRAGQGGGRGGQNGQQAPQLPDAGTANTGAFNPVLGYSYEELASMSRSMHHSQGTGAMRQFGGNFTSFGLAAGKPSSKDLFDGVDTTWNRLPGGAAVGPLIAQAIANFDMLHPEKAIPALTKARPLIAAIDDPLAKIKLVELDETIAQCAGLWLEAQARQATVSPGASLNVTTTVLNRSTAQVTLESAAIEGIWNMPLDVKPTRLANNQSAHISFDREVPINQPYSQPYWLKKPPAGDVYQVDDQTLIGLPDTPPVAQVRLHLTVEGTPIEVVIPVHNRYAPRAEGERIRPLVVVPAVAVDMPTSVAVFPAAGAPRKVQVAVKANIASAAGEVRLDLPEGWKSEPKSQPFKATAAGEDEQLSFDVTPPAGEVTASMKAVATVNGRDIANGMQVISYPHFPPQTLFPPSEEKLVRANIDVKAHKVGYIMGAGDEMPDALRQLGIEVTLLTQSDLEQGDLSRFDAIVAGVRSYNVRADLRANQAHLMNYVKNGGTYIVQYQNADPSLNMGPYPFTVPGGNRYRVTVEEAPMTFPHQDSPLLQYPNHIVPKDFDGWIQERAVYVATQWDKQYQTVMASHDPDEEPMEGGELWTHYGKGVYIFTAYAWFRELPAGVPGAFRLFANLLSAK
jgi:LmbE family N-acetylglucosaminyl deacetylase